MNECVVLLELAVQTSKREGLLLAESESTYRWVQTVIYSTS